MSRADEPAAKDGASLAGRHFPEGADELRYAIWDPAPRPEGCPFQPGRFLIAPPSDSPDKIEFGPPRGRPAPGTGPNVDFGKHRGKPWSKVPESYLRWMVGNQHSRKRRAEEELKRRGLA